MCRSTVFLFFFLLFFCSVVSAQDQRYYLITETELQNIETTKQNWETSKQTWLSQVSALKAELTNLQTASQTLTSKLETSLTKSTTLQSESINLNKALAAERETSTQLRKSFNEFEAEKLHQLSLLSSEVANQREKVLEAEKKLTFWRLLAISVISIIIIVIGIRVYLYIKKRG